MNIEIRKVGEARAIFDHSLVRNQHSDIASTINQDKNTDIAPQAFMTGDSQEKADKSGPSLYAAFPFQINKPI